MTPRHRTTTLLNQAAKSLLLSGVLATWPGLASAGPAATKPAPAAAVETRTQGNLVLQNVPQTPAALAERMRQYQNARAVRLLDVDATGALYIATRFGETNQVHRVSGPLQMREQLTFLDEPVASAKVRPAFVWQGKTLPAQLLMGVDRGGSEFWQLLWWDAATGQQRLLTDGKSRHESAHWSPDGQRIAYVGTARNGKDFDLYVQEVPRQMPAVDAPLPAPKLLRENNGSWQVLDWSDDGKHLLVKRFYSIEQSEVWTVDAQTGDAWQNLPVGKATHAISDALFAPDGGVYAVTDRDSDVRRLVHVSKDGVETPLQQNPRWGVETIALSADRKRLALSINEDGYSRVYTWQTSAPNQPGKLEPVQGLPDGMLAGLAWRKDGETLAVNVSAATSPADIWVAAVPSRVRQTPRPAAKTPAPTTQRWTRSEIGGLSEESLRSPQLIRYPTFDKDDKGIQRTVPAFVYKPRGKGPFPYIIQIHGGPEAQARPWFDPTIQFWVQELGVAVLIPNVRGSDGYGKAWLALDNGKLRENSVKDIGALLDWANRQPDLDSKRAAVYGGSYGGYMVLASLVHYGARLKAGVDVVGISNFVSFLENTQAYRRDNRRAEYGDERDPAMRDFLQAASPLTHVARIRSRLFVVQGANDPRVPQSEAEQVVAAVRAAGQPVWYMLAKDEGHGFQKKANRDAMGQAVVLFWQTHLLQEEAK
jgi:dipeptidyl aminopeptidase/acylaminoacyl peptidase